jgi:hypothetical protein
MAAEPIHVEAEDEVPAIIERIRRSSADEVHLVLPPQARFGQSRFNFQLLKQYSTRLGKRVAIWSPDPVVQRLAEESGFGGPRPEPNGQVPRAVASAAPPGPPPVRSPIGAGPRGPVPGPQDGRPFPGRPGSAPRPGAPVPLGAQAPPGAVPPYAVPAPPAQPPTGRLGGLARLGARPGQLGAPARIRVGSIGRRLPSRLTQSEPARYALYGGAILVLLAGILAVLFYVPTARVTLVAQAQPFSTSVDVTAEPAKGSVHVRPVTATRTLSAQQQATGTKTVQGQLGAGQFTYVNNCSFALQIASGQRLRSASGAVFAQLADTAVDQGGQRTVDIKAVQSGQAGNVGAGQIATIVNNQYSCLSGTNQGPTAGGTDDQKQTVIQTSDIQSVRTNLEQQLRQQILTDLDHGIQKGEKLPTQPQIGNEQFNTTHNVDENYPNFTATLKLDVEADYYTSDDVDRAFSDKLASKVPSDQQLTTNKVVPTYTVTAGPGGHLDFAGTASGYIAPRIDVERIKGQLAGKSATQAHDVLTRLPVQRSLIDQSPPLPLMPLSASRIFIDYGVEAQSPPKTG